ncbi:hypothetical protein [Bordetella sp. 2513F-2]
MIPKNNPIRLTDELERQLMLQAMEEQFRPHPIRALAGLLRKLAQSVKNLAGKTGNKTAHAA